MPKSLLETTLNTRDLGGYRSVSDGKILENFRILRSDVQNHPSEKDLDFLKEHNISTIIDMRGEKDTTRKPSGFVDQEGFSYIHIPIDEGSGIPESVDQVGASYLEIAQAKNMPHVFKAIANAEGGVMFNCTAGKDRTGVVSAVILSLCGVSREDVIRDYMITRECNRERFELIHKNFPAIDMNIVIPSERYMQEFFQKMEVQYGGVMKYLLSIGVKEEEIQKIIHKLKEE